MSDLSAKVRREYDELLTLPLTTYEINDLKNALLRHIEPLLEEFDRLEARLANSQKEGRG